MTTQTATRGRVARWVACALVATACLCVGSVPARADDTPVRIASATPTAPEPGTLMPGNEITMDISIRYGLDGSGTDMLDTVEVTIRLSPWGLDNDFRVKGQNVCLARRVAGVRFGLFECRLSGCSRCR